MQSYISRFVSSQLKRKIRDYPVTAILGPRQCGKSTLAKQLIGEKNKSFYLDLERASDLNKLTNPESFFEINADKLICLDEIQRAPEIFPLLRSVVDTTNKNGQLLLLGSASRDLIRQSSESLAGRISYIELTPFLLQEISKESNLKALRNLWLKGGYPRSYLSRTIQQSYEWRLDFIRTYLERDIPQLGFEIPATNLEQLWRMSAHLQGQVVNFSKLGQSLGASHHTAKSYLEILEKTFILRLLKPYTPNLKKRLIKSPKIYIRDSGLLHALLSIETQNDLLGHPVYGFSWEGFVIENIIASFPDWQPYFYRTSSGTEIDLILEKGRKKIAIECKVSKAPQMSKGFWQTLEDLQIKEAWIISPIEGFYPLKKNVMVSSLDEFISKGL